MIWGFIIKLAAQFWPYIVAGLLLAGMLGWGQIKGCYWEHRAHNAENRAAVAETENKVKDVEVKYAPKIKRMDEIAKQSKAAQLKPGQKPPPLPDPGEVERAKELADIINGYWGESSPRVRN